MSILVLVLILAFLGVCAYFTNTSGKINSTFKFLINIVLVAVAVILILSAFGVWDQVKNVQVPKL